jgi:hypothetical protein
VRYELASRSDDESLRRLLRENPMAGPIALTLEREPDYFRAAAIEGPFHQVIVGRDADKGDVIGMGTRSVRPVFVNGEVQDVGYLGQLRVLHQPGKPRLVSRALAAGFGFLKELHADGKAAFYLTSIAAGNAPARRLLTAGLAGYPRYREYAPLATFAIALGRQLADARPPAGVRIIRANETHVGAIHDCLTRNGPRRQFAPLWRRGILFDDRYTPDLGPEDFLLAIRRDEVVGCVALWDQSGFKRTVVRSYSDALGRYR